MLGTNEVTVYNFTEIIWWIFWVLMVIMLFTAAARKSWKMAVAVSAIIIFSQAFNATFEINNSHREVIEYHHPGWNIIKDVCFKPGGGCD